MVESSQNLLNNTLEMLFFKDDLLVYYACKLVLCKLKYKVFNVLFCLINLKWLIAYFNKLNNVFVLREWLQQKFLSKELFCGPSCKFSHCHCLVFEIQLSVSLLLIYGLLLDHLFLPFICLVVKFLSSVDLVVYFLLYFVDCPVLTLAKFFNLLILHIVDVLLYFF